MSVNKYLIYESELIASFLNKGKSYTWKLVFYSPCKKRTIKNINVNFLDFFGGAWQGRRFFNFLLEPQIFSMDE